jgi:hypothetical protein
MSKLQKQEKKAIKGVDVVFQMCYYMGVGRRYGPDKET